MKQDMIANIRTANPGQLESMYRTNKSRFREEFTNLYPELKGEPLADFWNERLSYESAEISWGSGKELLFVIVASLIAGTIAKIPHFANLDPEYFYPRNIAFIIFPALAAFFLWMQKASVKKIILVFAVFLISAIYINFLPGDDNSDTFILACIHLPLLLWALFGFSFLGNSPLDLEKRLGFLRFNGDLVVMTTIILIAGGLLTGITLGLFHLIDLDIESFYFNYIAIWGAAAAPILGAFLVQTNPHLVNKVSPVIAKVFTPLVLIMLLLYLGAVIYTGKDPYNDREFLLIFNMLLLGVMAIILFSIAETLKKQNGRIGSLTLLGLSIVTIIVNGIALTAIIFRISEWGFTPNRLAVLGGNLLILTNLLIVTYHQLSALKDHRKAVRVESSIARFLPVYIVWAAIVAFIFPVIFGFE
ncbi:DUF4153 domain-containing protein [Antarcticibacterium flavum]|uniref:DUF4153 domain-containing protein n=1 Tax=Antarcticibacterium flavum TaxID=2058175 RepID=A0A5B7WYA0_9FLAO|nr:MULTISPECIES: DUF4153 domain-containing protein [Antarcticibacterium]MCM4158892.1 hypothetical protein [Antarcticibacterium sp. W02-3]QCY68146.1 DUF4153 domain-containing protein [Antarcticibacterium flavum]